MKPSIEIGILVEGRKAMKFAADVATVARHPWNSPEWFRGVPTCIPAPIFARMAGHSARALMVETLAAEQFRAKLAFAGV